MLGIPREPQGPPCFGWAPGKTFGEEERGENGRCFPATLESDARGFCAQGAFQLPREPLPPLQHGHLERSDLDLPVFTF